MIDWTAHKVSAEKNEWKGMEKEWKGNREGNENKKEIRHKAMHCIDQRMFPASFLFA